MLRKCSRPHATALSMLLSSFVFAPACLVAFDDYPLGDPNASMPVSAGVGGTAGSNADGGAASGGEGGAGASAGAPSQVEPDLALIDDFEDGDARILENDGRSGTWRVSSAGSMEPVPSEELEPETLAPPRGESASALHASGTVEGQWPGAVRATLDSRSFEGVFDASRYTGIKFWGRSANGTEQAGRATLPTSATTGDTCFPCGDHFGSEVVYTPEWQEYAVPFAEMSQEGWGDVDGDLDPAELVAIQFSFADTSYDVWIDDVRFY